MSSSTSNVTINVIAKDKTNGVFGNVSSRFKQLGTLAAGAVATGVTAIGTAAVKSFQEFTKFEDGMNEVFTLMPNLTESAMTEISDQVKSLSKDMAVIPSEVAPALYQAISAGVPQDNVFSFLETAQKAAVGGITDLTTSVDAISSVVNTYGDDVISAAQASDIMFTTVRLGKTTFGEMASSISNVNPLAKALNVSFGAVGASMATMTAQGTSTSQSATQLRSLLGELGKSGTKVANIFKDQTGQSFAEFMAETDDLSAAMSVLQTAAEETGTPIQDFFGSVEAGGAALQLTGSAFETFQDNLGQVSDSAGATDAAFARMNQGFSKTVDRIKANVSVAFINLGEAMSPVLGVIAEMTDAWLPVLSDQLEIVSTNIQNFIQQFIDGNTPLNDMITSIQTLWEAIEPAVSQAAAWIAQYVELQDVFVALGIVLAAVVIPIIISVVATILPLIAVAAAVVAAIALLRNAWEQNWFGIQEITATVVAWIQGFIESTFSAVRAFWEENGEAIMAKAQLIWTAIQLAITAAIIAVKHIIEVNMNLLREFWAANGENILAKAREIWEAVYSTISSWLSTAKDFIFESISSILAYWGANHESIRQDTIAKWTAIKDYIATTVQNIKDRVQAGLDSIKSFWDQWGGSIKAITNTLWTTIKTVFQTGVANLKALISAFTALVKGDWETFGASMKTIWSNTWNAVTAILESFRATAATVFEAVSSAIYSKIQPAIDSLKSKFSSSFSAISGAVNTAKTAINEIKSAAQSLYSWLSSKVFTVKLSVPSFPSLPGFADGGQIMKNQLSIVGERGPELFLPGQTGTIIPNHKVGDFLSGGGSGGGGDTYVTNEYNINATYQGRDGMTMMDDIKSLQLLQG